MATLFPIIIITITSFMFHVPLHYNHFPSTLAFFFSFWLRPTHGLASGGKGGGCVSVLLSRLRRPFGR